MNKKVFKRTLKILLAFLIVFFVVSLIKYKDTVDEAPLKIDIPTMQISKMSIINGNRDPINLEDLDLVVLYNTVFVPLNDTFTALFDNDYTPSTTQTITYASTEIIIDATNNTITIPNYYIDGEKKADNTVVVEIEEYKNKKYIPLYLISNIGNIVVKLDGTEIYNSDNYVSSYDVIKRSSQKHSIEISTEKKYNNDTYFGQAKGSLWREEALKRIEKYRKKEISFVVKNQNDLVIDNADIQIRMDTNNFKFGTAIVYQGKKNNYNGITRNLFNMIGAENGFKWAFISAYGYGRVLDVDTYALNNNMATRGHCLWWDRITFAPELQELIGSIDNPTPGTMAYVYKNYNDGKITLEEAETFSQEIQNRFETLVLNHIEDEIDRILNVSEWDVVNEILTSQFFKIYLYDRVYLTDSRFLEGTQLANSQTYTDNEDYYIFLAKCFDKAREISPKSKLVLNDNIIYGNIQGKIRENNIRAINNIKKYTNNIEALGIQYHAHNRYYYSPQGYYNNINSILNETGIKEAVITEYDNYTDEKKGNYTAEERQIKAEYLRDTLIAAYSNPNISEFCFWVYNSTRFDDEEREAYEEFVTPLLNYEEHGISDENGYTTRLYKGTYTAKVTLPNGKEKTVDLIVNDDSSNYGEIIFISDLTGINIEKLPDGITLCRGDELNLNGGVINAFYDDDTVEQIDMNDAKVRVSGYNKNVLGKQTITLTYEGKSVTFDVNVIESMDNIIQDIKESNNKVNQINRSILNNENVSASYEMLFSLLNKLKIDSNNNSMNRLDEILDAQFRIITIVLNEYNSGNTTLTADELTNVILCLTKTTDAYKLLYSYYFTQEPANINETVQNALNTLIDKYNDNSSFEMEFLVPIIQEERSIYQNELLTDIESSNYLNKQKIIKVSNILSSFIENRTNEIIEKEIAKLKITTDKDTSIITDQNITVTLEHGNYTKILNNEGKDTYTFTENDSFVFEVKIGTKIYNILVTIDNIDRPTINSNSKYKVGEEYITQISKNTNAKAFKEELLGDTSYKIYRKEKEIQDTVDNVATGDVLRIGNKNYILIVMGDINFDGKVSVTDLMQFKCALLGISKLSDLQKKAADINENNQLSVTDLLQIKLEIVK